MEIHKYYMFFLAKCINYELGLVTQPHTSLLWDTKVH